MDESCAAGCGQHPPGRCVLPRPRTTKLPAQGTVRQQHTLTQIAFTYKQTVCNKYSTSHTLSQVRSECLMCTFKASCCSARLSRAQVPAFACSSVRDRKKKVGGGLPAMRVQGSTSRMLFLFIAQVYFAQEHHTPCRSSGIYSFAKLTSAINRNKMYVKFCTYYIPFLFMKIIFLLHTFFFL